MLTGGESGVTDGYNGAVTDNDKRQLRQREQLASCRLFGPDAFGQNAERIHFLKLSKSDSGSFYVTAENCQQIVDQIRWSGAGILILPHGHDSNKTHQFCAELVVQACKEMDWRGEIWFNRDEKTLAMRDDLFITFDQDKANWKAQLLRAHQSQQHRNQETRGHGFDERVLQMNARTADSLGLSSTQPFYVESFEIQRFG